MRLLLIIICTSVVSICNTYAQETIFPVSGKVIDENSQTGIPYVNVYIEGTTIGTVTNIDGDYEIKVPCQFKDKLFVFSFIGYETEKHKIKAQINVNLKENPFELSEIIVKPLKPLDLLQKAIAKIPENYSTETVYLDAFYRSLMKEDSTYINLMEAACNFHYVGYSGIFNIESAQKRYYSYGKDGNCTWNEGLNNYFDLYTNPNDQVKIIEARISEYHSRRFNDLLTVGGPLNLIAADKVKYLNEFMDNNHFKHYKYKIEGRTTFNDREVIIISFKPKAIQFRNYNPGYAKYYNRRNYFNAEFEGNIYLDIESLAFIRFDYNIVKVKPLQNLYPHPYSVRIDYKKINDKWYLSQIHRNRLNSQYSNKSVNIDSISAEEQLIVNRVRIEQVKKFQDSEIFPHSNYHTLYRYPMAYNKEFWNEQNIITHNKLSVKATKDLERYKSLERQFIDMQVKNDSMPMPIAKIERYETNIHNKTLKDEYKWLEDINDENVLKYIKDENKYTYNYFIPLREKQNSLFKEMVNKLPKRENSSIYDLKRNGVYKYYQRFKDNSENSLLCRINESVEAKEEVVFDFNNLANKYDYLEIYDIEISPDNKHVVICIDTDGSERKTGFVINIKEQSIIKDSIQNIWDLAWANDGKSFYYVHQDSLNRPSTMYKHILGEYSSEDELIYYEEDKYFDVSIRKSELDNYIFLSIGNNNTSELRYLELNNNENGFKIFRPREKDHIYRVKEAENEFYILSNKDALNNRLFKTSKENLKYEKWEEVITASKDTLLQDFHVCENFLILSEIYNVQQGLRLVDLNKNIYESIKINEEYYSLDVYKPDYYSDNIKISVSTFINPTKIYEYNMSLRTMTLLDETNIENYSPKDYMVDRIWSISSDGTRIPITLVYKKKVTIDPQGFKINKKIKLDGSNPLILEAYGAYGNNTLPRFSIDKICMLERGFIYAIAHVRGSTEMGKEWHKNGSLLNKRNTFGDYVSCANFLIKEAYTDSSLLFGLGGSAGGMLMGVVANSNPELFKGIILEYPQVCQLDALMDSSNMNHQEFGNPYIKEDFEYIKLYSPYENIKEQKYPAMLFVSGLNDQRVYYWNATKMVASLRTHNKSNNPILLKTYNSGHTGLGGKYGYYRSMAFEYAFYLSLLD